MVDGYDSDMLFVQLIQAMNKTFHKSNKKNLE